jgi:acetylserotonin N-methyltransferase
MHAHSFSIAMRVAPTLGLSDTQRVLDGGGGSGSFSIAMAVHHPSVRCTVLDFPVVCEVAEEHIRAAGVSERVGTAAGNLFVGPWPEGHDRVFFNDIFHDWDDERCAIISHLAFEALPAGGRVMVHEMLLSDTKDGPLAAAAYSMAMVFATRGRQRSARELIELLEAAGFVDVRVGPTTGGYALIEGSKP